MDFSFPETHTEIQALALAIVNDHSNSERLKKLEADGPYFDKELWGKFVETSVHSASLAEALGGMGMDYAATSMVAEAIGHHAVSIPYIPCVVSACLPLQQFSDNELVRQELSGVIEGSSLLSTAFIEPYNENPCSPKSTVIQSGDNWLLDGVKHCVPYAADASKILLAAMHGNELWAGLVDPQQDSVEVLSQYATSNELQYQLTFTQAEAHCVAQGADAVALIEKAVAMTTVAYCSMAVGVATRMTKISGEYTSQREQFGVPLATFQAVAHKLANSYIDAECLKIITLKACSDVNQGDYNNDSIHMAKMWCGDVLHRVSQTSQHVHGGTGIDRDYHLFRFCLWAKQLELSLGNSRVHLAKLADNLASRYLATCE
jgi:alkylation response protein AidB-like acyl-CoA dehydrogenase